MRGAWRQVNGGLMLIIGLVPDSEREYIQFLGRTARQDKRGQFAAVLLASDYSADAVGGAVGDQMVCAPGLNQTTQVQCGAREPLDRRPPLRREPWEPSPVWERRETG
jgi:hypothetical protein